MGPPLTTGSGAIVRHHPRAIALYTHDQQELDPRVGELFAVFLLTHDQDDDPGKGKKAV